MASRRDGARVDRRGFLRGVAADLAGTGLALAAGRVWAEAVEGRPPAEQSVVVDIRDANWQRDGQPDPAAVKKMLEDGMKTFTGKGSWADAWKQFVQPNETVCVKFNRLSGNFTRANQAMVDAIVDGLQQAGLKREKIIVVEAIEAKEGNLTEPDLTMGPEVDTGHGKTRLTRLITDQVDGVINVCNLKDHAVAGVTGALKNLSHAGKTFMDKPENFHGTCCDPHVGEINLLKPIRSKGRLNICNGLVGMLNGGPTPRNPRWQWPHNGLLISTDPVAMDTVILELVQAARKEHPVGIGQADLFQTGRKPVYIQTCAKMGLGEDERGNIKVVVPQ